ncbi:unnamed protein product [Somion occarium]|uniref:Uncharacterized protein n=1 Tax=Somion occarium TaxID=3059160 RepID=A0ABP1CPG4_9APHY
MLRTAFASNSRLVFVSRSRAFHPSPLAAEKVTERVKEVVEKVDKTLGKKLAEGIEKTEHLREKTKDVMGKTHEKTKETAAQASQKANQTAAGAREGKEDVEKEFRK